MSSNPMAEAIRACVEHTGWTEREVRNVLGSVVAKTPDDLLDALPEVIAWAAKVEAAAATISLAKELPRGILELRWTGQEVVCRIRPSCNVRETLEGWEIDLPDGPGRAG